MSNAPTGHRTGAQGLTGATFSAIDLADLRTRATGLPLDAHRPSRGGRSGARISRFRARGMEYAESRLYLPGDDIRTVDWRVTARTGSTHTKLFHEERARPVLFAVDLGQHMQFGTQRAFKSVVAAEAAALLAWATITNGDRAGGLVFTDERAIESRVVGGRRGALALIRALVEAANVANNRHPEQRKSPGYRFENMLLRAHRIARPGTLVVVISDFSGLGNAAEAQLAKLREHHDLLCVWIHDRLEAVPPPPGRYPIGDGQRTATLDTHVIEVTQAIAYRFDRIEARVRAVCRHPGAALVRIRCGDDVRAVIRESLSNRNNHTPS